MTRESFLRDIQRTLLLGGKLHFWTDVEDIFKPPGTDRGMHGFAWAAVSA